MSELSYWLVMPAAGSGRRFGGRKQYAQLGERSVLETALQLFIADARCRGGSLVLALEDPQRAALRERLPPRFELIGGGAERSQSVLNGLRALAARAEPEDWVLVHDAARPCLSAADLTRLLDEAAGESIGALLAIPVADTVKRAESAQATGAGRRALGTLARESLWLAQTPQMFRYRPLLEALERAAAEQRTPTDEAQAMEWLGFSARLVESRDGNPKLTSAADLAFAAAILASRRA